MPSPSSSRLAAVIVIFSSFSAVAVVGFSAKRSRPKRTSTSRNGRERGWRNRSSKLRRKRQRWTKTAYDKFEYLKILSMSMQCGLSIRVNSFNLSFQESIDDNDDSDEGKDEDGRSYFSEIERSASILDKELAASGFTKKDKEDIQMEGEIMEAFSLKSKVSFLFPTFGVEQRLKQTQIVKLTQWKT
ncbi:hypothetical protein Ahy_B10g104496 isoform A [Arachis hypogaea]|uniref:Uncharacterized protein n=1 Tax=Arachis hypogaea TaxID=3818 RepID=A0A444X5P3_ARAHY|nr:hypothetical protein Ahy_B10g104496 isoform A [Arachis hypogaea]